jgi:RsiW-degrading membrane proteinase PrsW (M82 family)
MPDVPTLLAAIALAIVPSLVYLAVLNAIDRYEKEPWTILLACLGIGAVVAPAITIAILVLLGRPAALPPAFAPGPQADALVPIVETLVCGVLLLVLVRTVRNEFDDVLDGVIYGAALGAGFGAAESFLYALGGTGTLDPETIALLVIAGLNHAFYLAVFGAIVGWAQQLPRGQAWTVTILGLATATLLHAFHDTLPNIMANVLGARDATAGVATRILAEAVNWLGILTLVIVVFASWRREGRILRVELADEVRSGVVPEVDYTSILSARARLAREWRLLRGDGMGAVRRLRRRYALEGELAFHKWRMANRQRRKPPAERGDLLRAEIRSLTDELPEAAA